jgi:hypothetical protein
VAELNEIVQELIDALNERADIPLPDLPHLVMPPDVRRSALPPELQPLAEAVETTRDNIAATYAAIEALHLYLSSLAEIPMPADVPDELSGIGTRDDAVRP